MKWIRESRDFALITAGGLISAIGSGLSSFALSLWVLQTTGSTTQFALTFLATALPAILVAPLAGTIIDRYDRRRIMMVCDLLSATVTFGIVVLLVAGQLEVWHIYVGVGSTSLFDTFRTPAFTASVPMLVPRSRLERANGLVQTGNAVAGIVSPVLAGVLVSAISFQGVLLIDGLTFVAGLATVALAKIPALTRAADAVREGVLREAAAGWRYVRRHPGLLGLLTVFGSNNFVFAMACVLIAPLLLSFTTATMLGIQYSISGIGLFLGGVLMTALGGHRKRAHGVLIYSALGGVALALHGLQPSYFLITAMGFLLFLMFPVISASSTSLWQTKVPAELQGRCFAIQHLVINVVTAAGYLIAGPGSEMVFEPAFAPGGALAGSVGALIGTGTGRGIAFMFILMGLTMTVVAAAAARFPAVRKVDELPDMTLPAHARRPSDSMEGVAQEAT
jgi:MFS family permease